METESSELSVQDGTLALPGDRVGRLPTITAGDKRHEVRLGDGIITRGADLIATQAGYVRLHTRDTHKSKIWIDGSRKRYHPIVDDGIVGIVTARHADDYRLDINATDTAVLPALAFQGATKQNKPNLRIGDAVYCRVTLASKHMEVEVSCIQPGNSKSWVSKETLYGELKNGNMITVSLALAQSLINDRPPILSHIGKSVPFESVVGANGRVWVHSETVRKVVGISLLISKAEQQHYEKWKEDATRVLGLL